MNILEGIILVATFILVILILITVVEINGKL